MATFDTSTLRNAFTNINYEGTAMTDIWSPAIAQIPLVQQDAINLMLNVRGKVKVYSGEVETYFAKYVCDFINTTTASLEEKYVVPDKIRLGLEYCMDEFRNTVWNEQIRQSALRTPFESDLEKWLIDRVLKRAAEAYENLFWRGDSESSDVKINGTDGIEKRLEASADVHKIDGAAFTTTNVISQVEAAALEAYNAARTRKVSVSDHKIYMNKDDVRTLLFALGQVTYNNGNNVNTIFNNYTKEGETIYVYGMPVVPTEISDFSIVVAPKQSLTLATDILGDEQQIVFVDKLHTTGDDKVIGTIITTLGTQILGDEIIVYSRVA